MERINAASGDRPRLPTPGPEAKQHQQPPVIGVLMKWIIASCRPGIVEYQGDRDHQMTRADRGEAVFQPTMRASAQTVSSHGRGDEQHLWKGQAGLGHVAERPGVVGEFIDPGRRKIKGDQNAAGECGKAFMRASGMTEEELTIAQTSGKDMPEDPRGIVRNNVKEKLARGEVVA